MKLIPAKIVKDKKLRNKLIVSVLIFAVIVFWGYKLLIVPQKRKIAFLNSRLKRIEVDIRRALIYKKKVKVMEKELEKLKKEVELLKAKLPGEEDLPNIIRSVARLAYYSGVNIGNINIGRERLIKGKNYAVIDMNVSFKADYSQLMTFFNSVNHLERLIKPGVFEIKSLSAASENPKLFVKGVLQTFRYVETKKEKRRVKRRR